MLWLVQACKESLVVRKAMRASRSPGLRGLGDRASKVAWRVVLRGLSPSSLENAD